MGYTMRQLTTLISIFFLIIVTAIACFATQRIQHFNLPIPVALASFNVALPALLGFAVERLTATDGLTSAHKDHVLQRKPTAAVMVTVIFTIYETVIVTLAGTYFLPRDSLTCGLQESWQSMFHAKDVDTVRRIQDGLGCCGLMSVNDRAWPFPDKKHDAHTCARKFERVISCFSGLRSEERKIAFLIMLVPICVFVWKIAVLFPPKTKEKSWLHRVITHRRQGNDGVEEGAGGSRQAIEYLRNQEPYNDNPVQQNSRVGEVDNTPIGVSTERSKSIAAANPLDEMPVLQPSRLGEP